MIDSERKWKTFMFYFGVPFCSVIVLSFWGFNPFGLRDRAPLWVKGGATLLLIYVIVELVKGYFRFDRNVKAMLKGQGQ